MMGQNMQVMALFILSLLFIVRILNNKYSKIDVFMLLITIILIATLRFHIVLLLILVSILYLLYFYKDAIIRITVIKILCLSIFAVVFSDVMVYQTSYLNGTFFLSGRLFINRGAELIFPNIFKKSVYMHGSGHSYIVAVPEEITKILYKANSVLTENGKELFGRNVSHNDIRKLGQGRYSIWPGAIYFSTSDNTNPNTNDRNYEVKINEKYYSITKLNDFSVSEVMKNNSIVKTKDIKKEKINYVETVEIDEKYKMDDDLKVLVLEENMPIMDYERIAAKKAKVKNEKTFKKLNKNSEPIIKKIILSLIHTCCAPYPWVIFSPGLTFKKFNELLLLGTFLWIISIPAFFMGIKHTLSNNKIRKQVSFLLFWVFSISLLYIIILGEFSTRQRQFVMPIIWVFVVVGYNLIFQRIKKIIRKA